MWLKQWAVFLKSLKGNLPFDFLKFGRLSEIDLKHVGWWWWLEVQSYEHMSYVHIIWDVTYCVQINSPNLKAKFKISLKFEIQIYVIFGERAVLVPCLLPDEWFELNICSDLWHFIIPNWPVAISDMSEELKTPVNSSLNSNNWVSLGKLWKMQTKLL